MLDTKLKIKLATLLACISVVLGLVFFIVIHHIINDRETRNKAVVSANISRCAYSLIIDTHKNEYVSNNVLNFAITYCIFCEKQRLADLMYDGVSSANKYFLALNAIEEAKDYTLIISPLRNMLSLSNVDLSQE